VKKYFVPEPEEDGEKRGSGEAGKRRRGGRKKRTIPHTEAQRANKEEILRLNTKFNKA